ncbi:MAG: L,D-transpeptidase [Lachnospiraceae bacterium]|nr:L,D-transpeptidase [Lachnospiraceae bacterium]
MRNITKKSLSVFLGLFIAALLVVGMNTKALAATGKLGIKTDRSKAECTYELQGVEIANTDQVELNVTYTDSNKTVKNVLKQEIHLDENNYKSNVLTGKFALTDLSEYAYEEYTVAVSVNGTVYTAEQKCDFTVHTSKVKLEVTANRGKANKRFNLVSTESTTDVIVPGVANSVKILAWKQGSAETTAKDITPAQAITNASLTWVVNSDTYCPGYGVYNFKAVIVNANLTTPVTIGTTSLDIQPMASKFYTKVNNSLEKSASFGVYLKGLYTPHGIKKINFVVFNSANKKVYTATGKKRDSAGTYYYATITQKNLKYKLDKYTVKAQIVDNKGGKQTLGVLASADRTVKPGKLSVKLKKDATGKATLKKAYIPGKIQKVSYKVYFNKKGKYKLKETVTAKKLKDGSFEGNLVFTEAGKYKIEVIGTTLWKKEVKIQSATFSVKRSHLGKNGWYYEKYNGKKYKFYYINNEKVTDLTKILKIKESTTTHTNHFYIELNRAACCVTIYAYDSQTKSYCIPVKRCSVSVGRDTSTTAGAGGLTEKTSYTPIGTYSICTNGQSVKYTMKPMLEPDGSTCYARWASHIVGNVYFHSIAVGSQSHYALNPNHYNKLGSPASAGCIRMTVSDAKWIYDYASKGSVVKIIKGNANRPGPLGKEPTIKVSSSIHYDPTDPGVPDSTKKKDYKAKKISGYKTKKGVKVGY